MEFKEFSIGIFNSLANAFDKIFKQFVYNKTNTIFKKNYQSSTASSNSFLCSSMNNLTASCQALFNGSLSYIKFAIALKILKSFLFTVAEVLKKLSLSAIDKPPKILFNTYTTICFYKHIYFIIIFEYIHK